MTAQTQKEYGKAYIEAIADNTHIYVSKRPKPQDRLFRSAIIDKKIAEVKRLLKSNPYLAWMFENCFPNTLETTDNSSTQQYIKSFCGVLKIVVIFIGAIVGIAIIFNKNPMTLFAGLGATSAVLMLVFKDTISGLVAGIRLTSNNMVSVGDWITVPKAGADGNVEEISLLHLLVLMVVWC